MSSNVTIRLPGLAGGAAGPALTDELVATSEWTDQMVAAAGIQVVDVPLVLVGGGIGSFVTYDYLRIAGVPKKDMCVLGNNETPWSTYEYLTRNSQIPRVERLRSDSASTPDCIWGFPSYAVREAMAARGLKAKLSPLWNVLTEPIFADYYTPRAGPGLRLDGEGGGPGRLLRLLRARPRADDPQAGRRRLLHDPHHAATTPTPPGVRLTAAAGCTSPSATRV